MKNNWITKFLGIVFLSLFICDISLAENYKCEFDKNHTVIISTDTNQIGESLVIEKEGSNNSLRVAYVLKGKLIEFCHLKNLESPTFRLKDKFGPDHERTFEIQVIIGKKVYSSGFGSNKKTAEQIAAQLALEELGATY